MLGAGFLLMGLGSSTLNMVLALLLISLGGQLSNTANLKAVLNVSPSHRRELTNHSLALGSLHRNVTGQILFELISAFGMVWIWLTGAISAFLVALLRFNRGRAPGANISVATQKPVSWQRGLGAVALMGCFSSLVVLQDIWLPRTLSHQRVSFLWFFLPYFVSSSVLRLAFARQISKWNEYLSIGIGAAAFCIGLLILAWLQTRTSVALAAMCLSISGALATPVVMVWVSDHFAQGAATVIQVTSTVFSALFALWFGVAQGEGFWGPPVWSLSCLLLATFWVLFSRPMQKVKQTEA